MPSPLSGGKGPADPPARRPAEYTRRGGTASATGAKARDTAVTDDVDQDRETAGGSIAPLACGSFARLSFGPHGHVGMVKRKVANGG